MPFNRATTYGAGLWPSISLRRQTQPDGLGWYRIGLWPGVSQSVSKCGGSKNRILDSCRSYPVSRDRHAHPCAWVLESSCSAPAHQAQPTATMPCCDFSHAASQALKLQTSALRACSHLFTRHPHHALIDLPGDEMPVSSSRPWQTKHPLHRRIFRRPHPSSKERRRWMM